MPDPWLLSPGREGPGSLRRGRLLSGRILQSSRSHGWERQTRRRRKGVRGVLERAWAENVCMGWWEERLGSENGLAASCEVWTIILLLCSHSLGGYLSSGVGTSFSLASSRFLPGRGS